MTRAEQPGSGHGSTSMRNSLSWDTTVVPVVMSQYTKMGGSPDPIPSESTQYIPEGVVGSFVLYFLAVPHHNILVSTYRRPSAARSIADAQSINDQNQFIVRIHHFGRDQLRVREHHRHIVLYPCGGHVHTVRFADSISLHYFPQFVPFVDHNIPCGHHHGGGLNTRKYIFLKLKSFL